MSRVRLPALRQVMIKVHAGNASSATYLNSESGFVKSSSVADGKNARVTALSLKAAKYASYTALMSVTSAGSTTKPMLCGLQIYAS